MKLYHKFTDIPTDQKARIHRTISELRSVGIKKPSHYSFFTRGGANDGLEFQVHKDIQLPASLPN